MGFLLLSDSCLFPCFRRVNEESPVVNFFGASGQIPRYRRVKCYPDQFPPLSDRSPSPSFFCCFLSQIFLLSRIDAFPLSCRKCSCFLESPCLALSHLLFLPSSFSLIIEDNGCPCLYQHSRVCVPTQGLVCCDCYDSPFRSSCGGGSCSGACPGCRPQPAGSGLVDYCRPQFQ